MSERGREPKSLAQLGVTMPVIEQATARFTGREPPLCGRCILLQRHEPKLMAATCERIVESGVVYYTGRCRECREYEQRERGARAAAPAQPNPAPQPRRQGTVHDFPRYPSR